MIPITIVDDFLDEPHQLVELANSLEFKPDSNGRWPGTRSEQLHEVSKIFHDNLVTRTMSLFQSLPDLGRTDTVHTSYGTSAVGLVDCTMAFQKIPAKMHRGWIHSDNGYATGILYLSENTNDGTSIYTSKEGSLLDASHFETKQKCNRQGYMTERDTQVQMEFNDSFEEHLNVKGKFNRLLLMPNCYHGANSFEELKEDRLTLVMFFHRISGEPMPLERMRAVRKI